MVLVGAYAGLRWGEAAALRPRDIQKDDRALSVTANLAQPTGSGPFRDSTMKTDSSRRLVAIGELTGILLEHAEKYSTRDWLFPTKTGGPLRASNWRRRYFQPAAKQAGLTPPPLRFHDLRHSHAALLIAQGEPALVIQRRLGHSTPAVTLNVYGHLFPGADEAAADKLTAGL